MKSLKTIQVAAKVAQVLCTVIKICCIIGICGCIIGCAAMGIGAESLKLGGVTLHTFLIEETGISTGTIWSAIFAGAILCGGELIVATLARRYFDRELAAGTPFTREGSRELMLLGVHLIWIPIVTTVLARVAQEIAETMIEGTVSPEIGNSGAAALGAVFIAVSAICRYGAELREDCNDKNAPLPSPAAEDDIAKS